MSVLKDMSWKSSSCSAQNKCPVFFLRSSHHFGPQKDFKESNFVLCSKRVIKASWQINSSLSVFRALLDEALSCVTCWGQPHCHSSLLHLASQDMLSVTQLPSIPWRRRRAAFPCSLLLAIPAEGCQAPAVQSAPGTHTPTAALIIPDTHPTGLVFKVELGSHNWSNRIVVHELLPCLTPKLHKTCKAACSIPFLSAPFPIKPLTPQLKHIFLKPKYCSYCCSWEYRKSLWFFSVHLWLFVLYTVASIHVELFQPQHKGSQCELRSSFQHWAEP